MRVTVAFVFAALQYVLEVRRQVLLVSPLWLQIIEHFIGLERLIIVIQGLIMLLFTLFGCVHLGLLLFWLFLCLDSQYARLGLVYDRVSLEVYCGGLSSEGDSGFGRVFGRFRPEFIRVTKVGV